MSRKLFTLAVALAFAGGVLGTAQLAVAGSNSTSSTMRRIEKYLFQYCKKHKNQCEQIIDGLCDRLADREISLNFCSATPPPPPQCTTQCNDGDDNDDDGLVDLDDPGCDDAADTDEYDTPPPPTPQCSDNNDNDADGLIDLDDPGCENASDDDEFNAPPAGVNHLLITEVHYDPDTAHGTDPANEWVEIFNGTGASVDLTGWRLKDASGLFDLVPTSTMIANNAYLVLTASSTTPSFWSGPGATFVNLGGSIGNGLGNTGDALYFINSASTTVDALSWMTNTAVFDPAAPDVADGHSLSRANTTSDTDTASDWIDLTTPTPGS